MTSHSPQPPASPREPQHPQRPHGSAASHLDHEPPTIGQWVDGLTVPVINERAVRASAGILFLAGFSAWMWAMTTGTLRPMQMFGVFFAFEMMTRLFVGTAWTPTLMMGSWLTRRQRPEWVDASSKVLAWRMGLGMALAGCFALGWLGLPAAVALTLCGLCLALLYAETAFGFCLGCALAQRFARTKPHHCAGDTCTYTPPARGTQHSVHD
ncbi:DUF4395 domain-containing protein [Demequina sp. B12]|uniref:DUF4395 domain-containing protein n=1 Tax=Demequina sp. B12 TaxID=2992757 RepID=UPI00237AB75D|nr:DUF4395 domain-containing protein [Demequina sp. B12]MDE0573750.1 DUF4395 domain-containing protein [Demequina sp. B12]